MCKSALLTSVNSLRFSCWQPTKSLSVRDNTCVSSKRHIAHEVFTTPYVSCRGVERVIQHTWQIRRHSYTLQCYFLWLIICLEALFSVVKVVMSTRYTHSEVMRNLSGVKYDKFCSVKSVAISVWGNWISESCIHVIYVQFFSKDTFPKSYCLTYF